VPAGPLLQNVTRHVPRPAAGSPLLITAQVTALEQPLGTVRLFYRRMYEAETNLLMNDAGTGGDATAGDGIFSATIPGTALTAGQMIRWRVQAQDSAATVSKMPDFYAATDSPEYYGTVPTDPAVSSPLAVLEWFVQSPTTAATATGTRCSLFYLDEFYDNVLVSLHGQSTSAATFLKKSYNFDFNRGNRFLWSPTAPRVKDIDIITNFGDKTKVRHPVAYELFREAGSPAHFCFTIRTQQNGQFHGLHDLVEDGDDVYLERAGLNQDGALYKMYNAMANPASDAGAGAEKKNRKLENNADLQAFLNGMHLTTEDARKRFFYDNLDLPKMISFMAANSVTNNIDVHAKNYYIYRDTGRTNEWTLLAWDLDLSFGRLWTTPNNYFDDVMYLNQGLYNGQGQNLVARLYAIPEFRQMAQRRIRSLHDRFLGPPGTVNSWLERRFAENLATLGAEAQADYAKWVTGSPTGNGPWKLVQNSVNGDSPFRNHTPAQEHDRLNTSYWQQRRQFVYASGDNVAAQSVPNPPALTMPQAEASPASGNQDQEFIEIRNGNSVAVDVSGWELRDAVEFTLAPGTVIPPNSSLYVSPDVTQFRARTVSPKGGEGKYVVGPYQGHLSNLGETIRLFDAAGVPRATFAVPATPSDLQLYLSLTEFCYKPVGDGLAEYLELTNLSSSVILNLGGAFFSAGIEFTFPPNAQLGPGQRWVLVRNLAAFESAHGPGRPVAGVFANGSALANGGERIKLEQADGQTILEFTYSDSEPWPALADTAGYSLVLIAPESRPDPAVAQNWRLSVQPGGSPGGSDRIAWSGDPAANADGDAFTALLEYALGQSDTVPQAGSPLALTTEGTDFFVTLERALAADGVVTEFEHSTALLGWQATPATLAAEEILSGGRTRQTWRLTGLPAGGEVFIRWRVTLRP
jgi:hypothetical protein